MRVLTQPLKELAEFDTMLGSLQKAAREGKGVCLSLSGCTDSQKLHMMHGLGEGFRNKLLVTYSDKRVREIAEEFSFYERNVMTFPARDLIFYQADIHGNELVTQRMKVLRRLLDGSPVTVVTTFDALMTPQIPLETYLDYTVTISRGGEIREDEVAAKLVAMGYEKNYQVEAPGQFSIRGGILDIFDLTEENPYRIELWGDEVDSLRSFDVLSQRSIENLESVTIYPATEMVLSGDVLTDGMKKIEKEMKATVKKLREDFKTEEAHRLEAQIKEFK